MDTCPQHIDRPDHQYNKSFVGNPFCGADIVYRIHKWVKFFLHSFNTTCLEDVEMVSPSEFNKIQRCVELVKWITSTPIWVEFPIEKEDGGRKLESISGRGPGHTQH